MSGTALKFFAFSLMMLDHIFQFLNGPLIFTMLGRISAPIFLFLVIEGYNYTASKKIYITRMYISSVIMGIIDLILNIFIIGDSGKTYIFNNIFALFFLICGIIYVLEEKENGWIKYLIGFQPIIIIVVLFFASYMPIMYFANAILPNILFVEGSVAFVIMGIILHKFRDNIYYRDISYILISLTYFPLKEVINGDWGVLQDKFQWLMVFSVLFFHIYNNKRGKGLKYFFYIGYPLHIILFNILAKILF